MWGRCCAERARERRIVILDHILKPWQATSFEPWQAMVVRHCGSGTGCMAVQWMMGGSCMSSGRLQRASGNPAATEQCSMLSTAVPACQPLPSYPAPPGPAFRRFFSPSLSSTVVIHAFIPVHRLGGSTLFGLAVRFQHVGLQSSHGGGAPRIIPLPISSRTYDLIHCASASATNSASFIACPS